MAEIQAEIDALKAAKKKMEMADSGSEGGEKPKVTTANLPEYLKTDDRNKLQSLQQSTKQQIAINNKKLQELEQQNPQQTNKIQELQSVQAELQAELSYIEKRIGEIDAEKRAYEQAQQEGKGVDNGADGGYFEGKKSEFNFTEAQAVKNSSLRGNATKETYTETQKYNILVSIFNQLREKGLQDIQGEVGAQSNRHPLFDAIKDAHFNENGGTLGELTYTQLREKKTKLEDGLKAIFPDETTRRKCARFLLEGGRCGTWGGRIKDFLGMRRGGEKKRSPQEGGDLGTQEVGDVNKGEEGLQTRNDQLGESEYNDVEGVTNIVISGQKLRLLSGEDDRNVLTQLCNPPGQNQKWLTYGDIRKALDLIGENTDDVQYLGKLAERKLTEYVLEIAPLLTNLKKKGWSGDNLWQVMKYKNIMTHTDILENLYSEKRMSKFEPKLLIDTLLFLKEYDCLNSDYHIRLLEQSTRADLYGLENNKGFMKMMALHKVMKNNAIDPPAVAAWERYEQGVAGMKIDDIKNLNPKYIKEVCKQDGCTPENINTLARYPRKRFLEEQIRNGGVVYLRSYLYDSNRLQATAEILHEYAEKQQNIDHITVKEGDFRDEGYDEHTLSLTGSIEDITKRLQEIEKKPYST